MRNLIEQVPIKAPPRLSPAAQNVNARAAYSSKLAVINGWRGYAILAVLTVHSFAHPFATDTLAVAVGNISISLGAIVRSGWIGVNAFFIASGFVLYLPYANGERAIRGAGDVAAFLRHRSLRLLPLCFLGCFISFIMFDFPPITDHRFWLYILNFPLATFSWIEGYNIMPGNGALWSISVEIALSAVFPALVLAIYRWGVLKLFVFVSVFCLANRLFLAHNEGKSLFWPLISYSETLDRILFLSGGDTFWLSLMEFVGGACFAHLYANGHLPLKAALRKYASPLFLLGATIVLLIFCQVFWRYSAGQNIYMPRSLADAFLPFLLDAGLYLIFAGVLYSSTGAIYWLFANRAVQLIGMMCYSIYIWHSPLLIRLSAGVSPTPWPHAYAIYGLAMIVIFIFSAFSYRFIEFPGRSLTALFLPTVLSHN